MINKYCIEITLRGELTDDKFLVRSDKVISAVQQMSLDVVEKHYLIPGYVLTLLTKLVGDNVSSFQVRVWLTRDHSVMSKVYRK